jgi:hypothetical protein
MSAVADPRAPPRPRPPARANGGVRAPPRPDPPRAYQRGADPVTDEAVARVDAITAFLRQRTDEAAPFAETRARLLALVS